MQFAYSIFNITDKYEIDFQMYRETNRYNCHCAGVSDSHRNTLLWKLHCDLWVCL